MSCANCDPRCVAPLEGHADRASAACGAILAEHKSTYVPALGPPIETIKYEYCKCIAFKGVAS